MAYTVQQWLNNVISVPYGPINDTRLAYMEAGIASAHVTADAAVPKDGVTVAATRVLNNRLVLGDAQPAFRVQGDGKHEWGPGGASAVDTNLYRVQANILKTDDSLYAVGDLVSGKDIAANQIWLSVDGHIYFGTALDTNLYRAAANILQTDDNFRIVRPGAAGSEVALNFFAGGEGYSRLQINSDGKHFFGGGAGAHDTILYRAAAGILRTDTRLDAGGIIVASQAGNRTDIGAVGPGGESGIKLGGAGDSILYRDADASLTTNNVFRLKTNVATIQFGTSSDVSLYRAGADILRTDDALIVGSFAAIPTGIVDGQLILGIAGAPSGTHLNTGVIWVNSTTGELMYRGPGGTTTAIAPS